MIKKTPRVHIFIICAFSFTCGLAFLSASWAWAQQDDASKEYFLGLSVEYKPDGAVDFNRAASHYEKAAMAGSREAHLALSRLYAPEGPLWSSPAIWGQKLRAAASAGWPEASFRLAQALENKAVPDGNGLNYLDYYFQAAASAYGPAALNIGEKYYYGKDLPQDKDSAALWLSVAAQNGENEAAILLGRYYYDSKPETAIKWLQTVNDNSEAHYLLGQLYLRQKRYIEAVASLTYASDHGHPEANLSLGLINLDNDFGRKTNKIEALRNFKVAAQAELPEGCYQLGRMYLAGQATPKDPLTAAFWFQKAGSLGHRQASTEYEKLVLHFTIGQKKALERMIKEGITPTMRLPVK